MSKHDNNDKFTIMTTKPIGSLIIVLSIPTVLSMLVTSIYNLVDTAFVGMLGNSASGAVGVVFGFMSILQAIGFLFGQGSGSILSRKLGAKDYDGASETASTGFFAAFSLSIIAAVICYTFLDDLVYFLGSTPTIAPYAKTYITCILFAAPFVTTSFTLNNILRYEGHAVLGMVGLMTGAVLNIAGDALLMFHFNMGILGAGIATAVSQIISFLILISMFIAKKTMCVISPKNIAKNSAPLLDIVTTGMPSLLRQGLTSITTVMLNSEAANYGDEAVAAFSIVSRVVFFVFSLAVGIGQGFQPVSGFNYGAKKYDRVEQGFKFIVKASEAIIIFFAIVLILRAPQITHIFRDDATVTKIATRALILQSCALLFLPYSMATEMLLQSTGHKLEASVLSCLRNGLFFIPLLLILSRTRGLAGIQEAQPLAYIVSFIPSLILSINFFKKLHSDDN